MDIGYYRYGSSARGESSKDSDIDVLVVCSDPKSLSRDDLQDDFALGSEGLAVDYSVYGIKRLQEMYRQGHLFSWHLYKESIFVGGTQGLLENLGKPNNYTAYKEDVEQLYDLLQSVSVQINASSNNLVYEAGIAFVCVRNIAMAASYFLPDGPHFSSYAPFKIASFPLTLEEYDLLRSSRLSGSRGLKAPDISFTILNPIVHKSVFWVKTMINIEGSGYEAQVC